MAIDLCPTIAISTSSHCPPLKIEMRFSTSWTHLSKNSVINENYNKEKINVNTLS